MRCEEYLQLLSTSPVEELVDGRAGNHLESCVDCNRATRVVVERERHMVAALAGMSAQAVPFDTARAAIALSRRRVVGRWYIAGIVVLLLAMGGVVLARNGSSLEEIRGDGDRVTTTFTVRCLSPTAAAELLRQQMSSGLMQIVMHPGSAVLTVSGSATDLLRARQVLARYDNADASTCVLPQPGTPKPQ